MDKMRQVKLIMIILTIIDFLFMSIFLIILSGGNTDNSSTYAGTTIEGPQISLDEEIEEETNIEISSNEIVIYRDDYQGNLDDSIRDIFLENILGSYKISENMIFNFKDNGIYEGFFDGANANMLGTYAIKTYNQKPVLEIYNAEMTAMVSYLIDLDDNDNIILTYEPANIRIILK